MGWRGSKGGERGRGRKKLEEAWRRWEREGREEEREGGNGGGRGEGGGNGRQGGAEEGIERKEGRVGVGRRLSDRRCPGDPLLGASLPASEVHRVGIVLSIHKPQCLGKGLLLDSGSPLMWF